MWPNIEVRFLPKTLVCTLREIVWEGPHPCTVPSSFISDGGSLKLPVLWLFFGHPFSYKLLALYIIHDYELSIGVPWMKAAKHMRDRLHSRKDHIGWFTRFGIGTGVTVYAFWKTNIVP